MIAPQSMQSPLFGSLQGRNARYVYAAFGMPQIIGTLKIDPCACSVATELANLDRHFGTDGGPLVEYVIERLPRDAKQPRDLAFRLAQGRNDVFPQQLSGMQRGDVAVPLGAIFGHQ